MILGLIGGVGSGKSAVTDVLKEKYGFELLLTDDIAKMLDEPGQIGYELLVKEFGEKILTAKIGSPIDNSKLAALIYSDSSALEKVNAIVHPITWDYVENHIKTAKGNTETEPKIVVETALPCERFVNMCDEIWFIYTEEEIRIERLMSSRGYTEEKCRSMIQRQYSDEEFSAYADYMIDNSGSREETIERIEELLV